MATYKNWIHIFEIFLSGNKRKMFILSEQKDHKLCSSMIYLTRLHLKDLQKVR